MTRPAEDAAARAFVPRPSAPLRDLQAYRVPRPPIPVDLRLDGNEGLSPAPELVDALRAAGPEALRRYPDAGPLEAALALRHGVDPAQVIVTAGADEALDRLFRALTWPEREVVLPWPSFVMIPHYARLAGARVRTLDWTGGPFPTDAVLAAVDERTALVFCVSPNNPTGAVATRADLDALCTGAPEALVVLDHAYAEFADEDLTAHALAHPNALVLRTCSKALGLAGLRVGYAVGPEPVVRLLRAAGGPYSVSSASLTLARAALARDEPRADAYREAVRRERAALAAHLEELGAAALPSQGNFVLARFGDAAWVRDALAGLGLGVRLFPTEPALNGCLRITCPGDADDYARLERALDTALAPQALVLDLDGVLVDGASGRGLVEPEVLDALRARLPLGIVTGLGAGGARRLLAGAGLEDAVDVVVTRDDAPAKPSPAGPRLCLQRLGLERAWMLGDNPVDCRAARAAGLVPLGTLGPRVAGGDESRRAAHTTALHAAGAARLLAGVADLGALLDAARSPAAPFAVPFSR